jgi:hypothetical protein
MAKELGQVFHQTAMREGGMLNELAYELAGSDIDDEAAVARLRAAFSKQEDRDRAVAYCLDWLARGREAHVGDRAYRIASAAATGEPIEALDPARVVLFQRLREMGEMPIGKAYDELVGPVPELARVVEDAEPLPEDEIERLRWSERQRRRVALLVGPHASCSDPLVRTLATVNLVLSYMHIAAGDNSLGTFDTPHRDIKRARLKELAEREGYTVEPAPGGRHRVTATGTLWKPHDPPLG